MGAVLRRRRAVAAVLRADLGADGRKPNAFFPIRTRRSCAGWWKEALVHYARVPGELRRGAP